MYVFIVVYLYLAFNISCILFICFSFENNAKTKQEEKNIFLEKDCQ